MYYLCTCCQCRISPTLGPPKMLPRAPLMVIYEKKVCYATSRGRRDFKTKYPNCRHSFGRTRPVARFWRLGGQNTFLSGKDFYFYYMFETNFSEHNKIWGAQKYLGVTAPRVCGSGQNRRQKVFHWGPSCLCREAWHSENLFLIHHMKSICRLCK